MTPFQITEPGIFRTRDGREVAVYFKTGADKFHWFGKMEEYAACWDSGGLNSTISETDEDLVSRIGDLPCSCKSNPMEDVEGFKFKATGKWYFCSKHGPYDDIAGCWVCRRIAVASQGTKETVGGVDGHTDEPNGQGHGCRAKPKGALETASSPGSGREGLPTSESDDLGWKSNEQVSSPAPLNIDRAYWLRVFAGQSMMGFIAANLQGIPMGEKELVRRCLVGAEALLNEIEKMEAQYGA